MYSVVFSKLFSMSEFIIKHSNTKVKEPSGGCNWSPLAHIFNTKRATRWVCLLNPKNKKTKLVTTGRIKNNRYKENHMLGKNTTWIINTKGTIW